MFGLSFREIVSNVVGSLVANAITPASMIGWGATIVLVAGWLIHWHRQQRAAKKPGMASWQFIALAFTVALIAVAFGAYGLGRKFSEKSQVSDTNAGQTTVPAKPPKPQKIRSQRDKERLADALTDLSDILNTDGDNVVKQTQAVISNWNDQNRLSQIQKFPDTAHLISELQTLSDATVMLYRAIYDDGGFMQKNKTALIDDPHPEVLGAQRQASKDAGRGAVACILRGSLRSHLRMREISASLRRHCRA